MRRFVRPMTPALTLLLAACASDTRAPVDVPPPVSAGSGEHQPGRLIGLAIPDLGELFGTPSLQVREGAGLKLQYRGGGCVLDAYLYAPENGQGIERVTYVDARLASGADTDASACEAQIERKR